MYLSRDEEAIYRGDQGETLRRMMEILVALDLYDRHRAELMAEHLKGGYVEELYREV